jgi:hypothetical protein
MCSQFSMQSVYDPLRSNIDDLGKGHQADGKVKSSRCKARTSFQAAKRNLEEWGVLMVRRNDSLC